MYGTGTINHLDPQSYKRLILSHSSTSSYRITLLVFCAKYSKMAYFFYLSNSQIILSLKHDCILQIASGLFNTTRFDSELSTSVSSLLTNLVPFPAVHFTTGALAPLQGSGIGRYNSKSSGRQILFIDLLVYIGF